MNRNFSGLENLGNSSTPRSWRADGSSTVNMSTTAAPAASASSATGAGSKPGSCTTCQKKRLACLGAGILLGIVGVAIVKAFKQG